MTPSESHFKWAVMALLQEGTYPSPMKIRLLLGREHFNRNLNGRECRWRLEVWEPWMETNPNHPITIQRRKAELHP